MEIGVWRNEAPTKDMGIEELHVDPSVGPHPKIRNGSSTKDGVLERLRCETIQKVVR